MRRTCQSVNCPTEAECLNDREAGDPTEPLHLNISGKSIGDPQLVALIDRALVDAQVDPSCLVFELTEAAGMVNLDHAKKFTTELRSRGSYRPTLLFAKLRMG